jgi:hypothetical protein
MSEVVPTIDPRELVHADASNDPRDDVVVPGGNGPVKE